MPHLQFDLMHAPADPPPGANPLIWRLAHGLRIDHARIDSEGLCTACGEAAPCEFATVALRGFLLAVGRQCP